MKPTPLLFAGIFASFAAAWLGLIVASDEQIGRLQAQVDEENETVYPINIGGIVDRGRTVYISNGCNQCHTQFVRDADDGMDLARQWGTRRTVALDYIYASGSELGYRRIGPDLTNAGTNSETNPARPHLKDPQWLLQHLYNPRIHTAGSVMPSYGFLFESRKIQGQRSANALVLEGEYSAPYGTEVVPTADAKAVVAYLLSLDRSHPLLDSKGGAPAAPKAK